ncbi:hypothetical protein DPMN_017219 [Dreissena polymorpha]|uniref:Uncharacterized protein n=1 Tax=Dreissena polymorpha TaxID=45954 RepID=A0A9D4NB02_DREPO|nr:hypothetical protein DPMN_017219 [Dreissena polymorpha]
MAYRQTSQHVVTLGSLNIRKISSVSAGRKDRYLRTCGMQTLSPCTRTRAAETPATTTEGYPIA